MQFGFLQADVCFNLLSSSRGSEIIHRSSSPIHHVVAVAVLLITNVRADRGWIRKSVYSNCGAVKVSHRFLPAVSISSALSRTGRNIQQETVVRKPKTVQIIDFSRIKIVVAPTLWKLSVPSSVGPPTPCFVCEIRFLFCCAAHYFSQWCFACDARQNALRTRKKDARICPT